MTRLRRVLRSPAARDFRQGAPYLGAVLAALAFFPAVTFALGALHALHGLLP